MHEIRRLHALHVLTAALLAGLLGLLTVVLAAPAASLPPRSTLVVGLDAEPKSLDPHATTALNDFRIITNIYEGLVSFADGSLEIEPSLAHSYEISDDGLAYTFYLRKELRFHDGTACDAEAVKFNFERMLDPRHPFHDTGPFPLAFFFDKVERLEIVDATTVRFRLQEPFAPLLSNLAYPTGLLISPAAVKKWKSQVGRHPSGTGPYRFADWKPSQRVVLERNANYHGPAPELERVVYRPITDPMTRIAELRAENLDVLTEISADNLGWFRESERFVVHEQAGPHLWFLILNTEVPPFNDRRVRQAVNYAVNKQALVDHVLQGTAAVAHGPIAAAFDWARDKTLKPYAYDPERARKLVREAGATGARVTLYAPESGSGMLAPVEMATAIQADLAAVGIQVRIETYEWNTFLGKVNAGLGSDVQMAEMAWMTNDPDTLLYLTLRTAAHAPDGFNSGYYSNPEVDELLELAQRTTERARRAELYRKLDRLIHEDAPWLFVASWKQNAVARRSVMNLRLQPSFFLQLYDVSKKNR